MNRLPIIFGPDGLSELPARDNIITPFPQVRTKTSIGENATVESHFQLIVCTQFILTLGSTVRVNFLGELVIL